MDPIFKWTGGKRKEIKIFSKYFPEFVLEKKEYKYIEPFFGGGAVYWHLENSNNVINDIDSDLINFLLNVRDKFGEIKLMADKVSSFIKAITEKEKEKSLTISEAKTERGKLYYDWRNKDRNNGISNLSDVDRAFRFYIINQLAFNGMRRFNSRGEFNIPYGNYKAFNMHIDDKHINLLKNTNLYNTSYKDIILNNDHENTFIFLDPPYTREFNEYSHGNTFGAEDQIDLSNIFKSIKNAKVMLVINKDEFISGLYSEYIKDEYDLRYSTNIKNRFDNSVKHLIITNY